MKNKLEQKLDMEFKCMNAQPKIFYFRSPYIVYPYRAITIATYRKEFGWQEVEDLIFSAISHARSYDHKETSMLKAILSDAFGGVAICDIHDQFNRSRGRIIAKGRLLKHLKEIEK